MFPYNEKVKPIIFTVYLRRHKPYRRGCICVTGVHSSTDIDSVLEANTSLTETSCKVISFRTELLRYEEIPQPLVENTSCKT